MNLISNERITEEKIIVKYINYRVKMIK